MSRKGGKCARGASELFMILPSAKKLPYSLRESFPKKYGTRVHVNFSLKRINLRRWLKERAESNLIRD